MSEALLILYVLAIWAVIFTVVALPLRARRGRPNSMDIALEQLDALWARGELHRDECVRHRRTVQSDSGDDRNAA